MAEQSLNYNEDNYKIVENISNGLSNECKHRAFMGFVDLIAKTAKELVKDGDEKLQNYVFHCARAASIKLLCERNEKFN